MGERTEQTGKMLRRWGREEGVAGRMAGKEVMLQLCPTNSFWKVGLTDKTLATFITLLPLCSSTLRSEGSGQRGGPGLIARPGRWPEGGSRLGR